MTRKFTAGCALALLFALVAFDAATSDLNPYAAPPAIALGSGEAASGAHCAAVPD